MMTPSLNFPRFGDLQGFFTKDNVANLTDAAGVEESLKALEAEASH